MTRGEENPIEIDWREVARSALSSAVFAGIVSGALRVLTNILEAERAEVVEEPMDDTEPLPFGDDVPADVEEAATLLGVSVDATADEVRAALRARLAASRVHPDQGGDGEEAKRLIAARNLLVERARGWR